MDIVAILKMVPDVVEELEVAPDGKSLDLEFLRLIVSERDEHALEQALVLKERLGGVLTVVALEAPDVEGVLYTALAKGADRAVKIAGVKEGLTTRGIASLLAQTLPTVPDLIPADLLVTGCQAIDDIDAQVAAMLAQRLGLPYVGVVSRVEVDPSGQLATVSKEYPAGVRGEFEVPLPALLGIQAAERPPRYVPVAKVRAAMKTQEIETVPASGAPDPKLVEVLQMMKPERTVHAEMIEGSPEDIGTRVCEVLAQRGLL